MTLKDKHDYEKFIKAQIKAIDESKWYEGERINSDPGQQYIQNWIKKNAKQFKIAWMKSKCRSCKKDCQHKVLKNCKKYKEIL
ncbi:MAG: hypothetical protein Q7R33_05005 [Nitrosarchaeum sp.]|nr:hypothetical protein [Nitrosarchaeum sp.]